MWHRERQGSPRIRDMCSKKKHIIVKAIKTSVELTLPSLYYHCTDFFFFFSNSVCIQVRHIAQSHSPKYPNVSKVKAEMCIGHCPPPQWSYTSYFWVWSILKIPLADSVLLHIHCSKATFLKNMVIYKTRLTIDINVLQKTWLRYSGPVFIYPPTRIFQHVSKSTGRNFIQNIWTAIF